MPVVTSHRTLETNNDNYNLVFFLFKVRDKRFVLISLETKLPSMFHIKILRRSRLKHVYLEKHVFNVLTL